MSPAESTAHLLYSLGLNAAAAVSFRNRLINGTFSINQRLVQDGPTIYRPGEFIRDRWRAGPTGCTAACKVAGNGDATIHIGAGSLMQIIEGGLYLLEGGAYCLSWQGTAIGRVLAPDSPAAFASGPVVVGGLPAGSEAAVEFSLPEGSAPVSLRLAQLEPGSKPTVFERRDDELQRCRRYFARLIAPPLRGVVCGHLAAHCGMPLPVPMRAAPAVSLSRALSIFDGNVVAQADAIVTDYGTAEFVDLDLSLSSPLSHGRPAVALGSPGGIIELEAEL
ncbi:hypothetical protein C7388_12953 [Methylobacterium radiotolerans]|nr:hypothetical protein C7388_12953 [Methylobacterium organophilum]